MNFIYNFKNEIYKKKLEKSKADSHKLFNFTSESKG